MIMSFLLLTVSSVGHWLTGALADAADTFIAAFSDPASKYSIQALLCTLVVSAIYICSRRALRGRRIRVRTVMRALFPSWLVRGASFKVDVAYFLIYPPVLAALAGWIFISYEFIYYGTQDSLTDLLGNRASLGWPSAVVTVIGALVLFIFFELGYWLDHYLSHNVEFLWQFHKVHHQAEILSPLTNSRMHPVDVTKFANIVTVTAAAGGGVVDYFLLGSAHAEADVSGILLIVPFYLFQHLQHSRLWIPFRGIWGRLFISPAHHQIHHSMNPADFNANLGQILAIWDWMFGTLRMPQKEREVLRFGVEGSIRPHSVYGSLLVPFGHSAMSIYRTLARLRNIGGLIGRRPSFARSQPPQ
jgi:sterol desaturase/sphingolipid hydroxylase (fatty acid hydroxylase superfamily)